MEKLKPIIKKPKPTPHELPGVSMEAAMETETEMDENNKSPAVSYREAFLQTKVAILHSNHPDESLREEGVNEIIDAIVDAMDKRGKTGSPLQFVTHAKKEGWLSITCNGKETLEWIIDIATKKPWRENTRVAIGNEIPQPFTCVTHVQRNMSKEQFLARIDMQNPDMNTKNWKVLRVDSERGGGQTFTFQVDEASADRLRNRKCKLYLLLSQIEVRIKDNRKKHTGSVHQQNEGRSEDMAPKLQSDLHLSDNRSSEPVPSTSREAESEHQRQLERGYGRTHKPHPYPNSSSCGKTDAAHGAKDKRLSSRKNEHQQKRHQPSKSGGKISNEAKQPFDIRKYVETKNSGNQHNDEQIKDRQDARTEEGQQQQ